MYGEGGEGVYRPMKGIFHGITHYTNYVSNNGYVFFVSYLIILLFPYFILELQFISFATPFAIQISS